MILLLACLLVSCTDNQVARSFGGTMTVDIPCNQDVFDVTWKGEDLWYATQDAPDDWEPDTVIFTEYSSFGVIEGTVQLRESRCASQYTWPVPKMQKTRG